LEEFWKIFSVFLTAFFGFGKVSVPSAAALFNFDFWKVVGTTCSGGVMGAIVFTNISAALMKWWHNAKMKWFRNHRHPKVFTKGNRRIIRMKKRFGIWGIALITPLGLSMPVGTFVAERFYKDKKKVILVFSIAAIFWYMTIYFLLLFFYDTITKYL
jgi:hypothetical protein